MRRAYAGVNASDVNYTAGRYFGGGAAAEARLPFDAGFEAVGVVAAVGPGVTGVLQCPSASFVDAINAEKLPASDGSSKVGTFWLS